MFVRDMYVFMENRPVLVRVRNYTEADFDELIEIQRECFPPPFPEELLWNKEQLHNHVTLFPEGAFCVEFDGMIIGSITTLMVGSEDGGVRHQSWEDVTDNGYIRNHDAKGDSVYAVDISVRPKYRKYGFGKILIDAICSLVIHMGLKRVFGGCRMPMYCHHAEQMTPEDYMDLVLKGELNDPVVTFLLRCGHIPVSIVPNYLDDPESCDYGVIFEWRNPFLK
ncbi:GNAT family N-acetyltransferase [Brevibacillus dissolubilis]|uniref:GNAT family N-acetyltransferase n=1 Tax=Brevibacillus dissolubilis TaxID=1844116 RepID=UPI001117AB21|nr:GNAT family N-acetyltransferase [Brevibacillus dissolubilis]